MSGASIAFMIVGLLAEYCTLGYCLYVQIKKSKQ